MTSEQTRLQIVEAALETLKAHGYAGASARTIAHTGGFNQALIFYHYGSVRQLLVAALDHVSERRMDEYGPRLREALTASELIALVRRIYDEDLARGDVTVLGEMVSAGVSDEELGAAVAARIEPWIELVAGKLEGLLTGSPLAGTALAGPVSPGDLAFAIVAAYFGMDMLGHLQRDRSRATALLEAATRMATLADTALGVAP
jgi:AcrR family transcriptional regulator